MFSFGAYNKSQMSGSNNAVVNDVDTTENLDNEKSNGPTQDTTMQDFTNTMSDTTNSAPGNMEVDMKIENLMVQVNDSLERELKDTKKTVKRILKEMVAFHQVAQKIHTQWAPIREAEYQEAVRLDELQADVEGTIGALPGVGLDILPPEKQLEPPSSI
jgi:hypothetical protein